MMKHDTLAPSSGSDRWQSFSAAATPPVEVFYVVQSASILGERHRLCSLSYETRVHADTELARLRRGDSGGTYSVWKSTTYVEPAEWLHRVVRPDGTLILPRLHGLEKLTDA